MNTINHYYQLLGISSHTSLDELKQAYRKKAKELHPDKNKSVNAHEDFIILNEAYEYVLKLKTGKISPKQTSAYYADWVDTERERAKAKAREYARMQYEEFIKSDHYKSLTSLATIVDYLYALFGISLFIIGPVWISFSYGLTGFIAVLLFALVTFPVTRYFIRHFDTIELGNFFSSLFYLIRTKGFLVAFTTIINLFIIFNVGLQTLISVNLLFSGIALVSLVTFGVMKQVIKTTPSFKKYFYSCCLAPLCINMLFMINFVFSSNPVTEKYSFKKGQQQVSGRTQESTLIHLDADAYDEFPGIRLFFDYNEMYNKNTITYTFKEGLFGIRVMTGYVFTKESFYE